MSAAEAAAAQIRSQAEERVRERIAEGQRAADYRIAAAEEEAAEILATARTEAERLRRASQEEAEQDKTAATSEALALVGRAQENADHTLEQATAAAANSQRAAERYSRELMSEARSTADGVRDEGLELAANLRQMGDALRANADRLLRDVHGIHSHMVSRIKRVEGSSRGRRSEGGRSAARRASRAGAEEEQIEVPEFIPPG